MPTEPEFGLNLSEAFHDLPAGVTRELRSISRVVEFAAGERIMRRGEVGNALYIVQDGTAFVTVPGPGDIVFEDDLEVGAVFGEMSLLSGTTRSADITARTDCSLLEIPFSGLRAAIAEYPKVAQFLTTLVGERLSRRDGIRRVGRYTVEDGLGKGGFAMVYRARHDDSSEPVALKMLQHDHVWRSDFAKRFRAEAAIIEKLRHPNIVRVHELVEAYATLFIAMELVEGGDLGELVFARGPQEHEVVRYVLRRTASALHHAHEHGIVHRDVKPANILMAPGGELKLVDFGIACGVDDGKTTGFFGTPHYAAPEHLRREHVDGRADVYMLGVTAFELLTGDVPFGTDTPKKAAKRHIHEQIPHLPLDGQYPDDLTQFVWRATRREPDNRFQSCLAAQEFLDEQGLPEKPPETLGAIPRRDRTLVEFELTVSEASVAVDPAAEPPQSRNPRRPTERTVELDLSELASEL